MRRIWRDRLTGGRGDIPVVMARITGPVYFDATSHLEQRVKHMTVRGHMASTIRTRLNKVHPLLRAALRYRMIASDPAAHAAGLI